MFIIIGGILLVLTLTSYTQAIEEPIRNNYTIKPNSDGLSDDFITNKTQARSKDHKNRESTFEKYLRKFEPSTIWEQIDKQKKYNGLIISKEEQLETIYRGLDPTDEIMELKVENGNPRLIFDQNGRRQWRPPKQKGYKKDLYHIRPRLYELMKQAIYTTRNKLVIMQRYRRTYRHSALYKMGFVMNKADNAARTFGKVSFRAYRGCLAAKERVQYRLGVTDLLHINERQLNLWFSVEILTDLLEENDRIAKKMFTEVNEKVIEEFDRLIIN